MVSFAAWTFIHVMHSIFMRISSPRLLSWFTSAVDLGFVALVTEHWLFKYCA